MEKTTTTQTDFPVVQPSSSLAHINLKVGRVTWRLRPPTVEKVLEGIGCIDATRMILATGTTNLGYGANRASNDYLAKAIGSVAYSVGTAQTRFPIKDLHCTCCVPSNTHKIGRHSNAIADR